MKKILLPSLVLACAIFSPEMPAQSDPNPAKTRALELRDALTAISENREASQESWDALRVQIDNYQKEYGATPATTNNVILLRKYELGMAKKFSDPARYRALLDQLVNDPIPAVAEMAGQQLAVQKRIEDLKTKPVELRFTAADGTAVDLAALRGKVVLVDFWAAWCPDCVVEAPRVVEAYKKYHDQGFEVLGISLDEDRDAMLAFAKQHGMTWPQYFDGKKWDNAVSKDFDIHSIPAMWLVDKKGMLAAKVSGASLAAEVERLLKAP